MATKESIEKLLNEGDGIFRLMPTWVPRSFCRPGKRIKLDPNDYYAFGLDRGGIDERWLSSTTKADNGPKTNADEGLSYIIGKNSKDKILLKEAIALFGEKIVGEHIWNKYKAWPMYSKFFDNAGPLPHHVHHNDKYASRVGQSGKPEMYFFPSQLNNHEGEFAYTFFGLNPEVTKNDLKNVLINFTKGDNNILSLSKAYKLDLDTGWDVPPGVLHAPGSYCTYEPQFASDVFAMYQSVLYGGHAVDEALLWKNTPKEELGNFDYLIEALDWDLNVDKDFHKNRFMKPIPVRDAEEMKNNDYTEEWICYKSHLVSSKRLIVHPGKTVVIKDAAAYGIICIQGHGKFGVWDIESPAIIKFGSETNDEFFVSEEKAKKGVSIANQSDCDDMVILKHFSENPDLKM